MRSGRAIAALALLPALLTGCGPKPQKVAVSAPVEAPSLPPTHMVAMLSPVPPAIAVTQPLVKLDTTIPPEPKTEAKTTEPRRPPKHHTKADQSQTTLAESKPAQTPGQSPAQTTQEATAQPPENSSIGQLSTGNDSVNATNRNAISSQIDSTENGLNGIKRPLSSDEQKTAVLIRSYITRARDALKADDLDGAKTLGDKAHQLLGELTKPQ